MHSIDYMINNHILPQFRRKHLSKRQASFAHVIIFQWINYEIEIIGWVSAWTSWSNYQKKATDFMMWFLIQNWTKIRKFWMMFRGTLCSTTKDGPRLGGGGVCQRDLDPSPPHNLDLCLFNTQKWITFCPIYSNLLCVCVKVQISVEKRTDRFRTDLRTDINIWTNLL